MTALDTHLGVEMPELRETHSGIVILLGDRAYKMKKPVDLGFLDFRTVQQRESACRRELELNRRLAPDVYLDVATVTDSSGQVREHLLVMRRMPDQARLATLVARRAPVGEHLQALAELLSEFHRTALRGPQIAAEGTAAALRRRWQDNLAETDRFRGSVIDSAVHDRIGDLAFAYVAGREELLAARAGAGLVVDGHGDLQAEDIFCLPDGPRVLDCIEFDERLRSVDVLDDIAFLAMDLERLGHPELAAYFVRSYAQASGADVPASLLHHYVGYRAFVRAKVACIRAEQGSPAGILDARALAGLALRHLEGGEVLLVLVGGAPATGKTTLATALAAQLDAELISSDAVRKAAAVPAEQRYAPAAKDAVYRELLERARDALARGRSVVADATWATTVQRLLAADVAGATTSRLVALECRTPVAVSAARAEHRAGAGTDASEAGPEVARRLAAERDPWPGAVPIDTLTPRAAAVADALTACRTGTGGGQEGIWSVSKGADRPCPPTS